MASNDQARSFNSAGEDKQKETFRGSKAQMCLQKILHIIKTIPPPPPPPQNHHDQPSSPSDASNGKRSSFVIDLNLTSWPSPLVSGGIQQNLESPAAAGGGAESESTVIEKASDTELNCDGDKGYHFSYENQVIDEDEGNVLTRDEQGLQLLMLAAKVVTGGAFGASDDEADNAQQKRSYGPTEPTRRNQRPSLSRPEPRPPNNLTKKGDGYIEIDDVTLSPVVRSKRGRIRVLPNKYKDSVLEPLTRLSRPNRSSSPVPTKHRSR